VINPWHMEYFIYFYGFLWMKYDQLTYKDLT